MASDDSGNRLFEVARSMEMYEIMPQLLKEAAEIINSHWAQRHLLLIQSDSKRADLSEGKDEKEKSLAINQLAQLVSMAEKLSCVAADDDKNLGAAVDDASTALSDQIWRNALEHKLKMWRASLAVGDILEVQWDGIWYHCKVVATSISLSTGKKKKQKVRKVHENISDKLRNRVKIHFTGYKKTHEKWIDPEHPQPLLSKSSVVPGFTFTPRPKPRIKSIKTEVALGKEKNEVSFFASALENNISSKESIVFTNRFGRKTTLKSIAPKFESGSREDKKGMDNRRGKDTCFPSFPSTYSSQENQLSDDHNDWHCSVCMAFEREEAEDDDILLSCDGPCLRSFHLSCVGLRNPPAAEESWLCDSCIEKEHTCFLCGDSGPISDVCGVDGCEERAVVEGCSMSQKSSILSSMVTKCSLSRCGNFFHLGCIESSGFFDSGLFSCRSLSSFNFSLAY